MPEGGRCHLIPSMSHLNSKSNGRPVLMPGGGIAASFPVYPNGSVGKIFLLPDWHRALQPVDGFAASLKGGFAMFRGNCDDDTRLANLQAPQPVNHGHAVDGELPAKLLADCAHLFERHGFVRLVFEKPSRPPFGMVPHDTFEDHDRAA